MGYSHCSTILIYPIACKADRILIDGGQQWNIWIDGKKIGVVVDRSFDGLCADLQDFYANKAKIAFDLKIATTNLNEMNSNEFTHLSATVRWGRKVGDVFRHGLELTEESSQRLLNITP